MVTDRYKLFYLIMISTLVPLAKCNDDVLPSPVKGISKIAEDSGIPEARSLFSPRVDYNEWMPVGRGDPLKNDPTYDYSPPTLDRVRYWGDSNKDKKEILLLGVSSKRQSHKKDTKFNTIRRSYYAQLPTRLMPPPLQTISPPKASPTSGYQNSFHYNLYKPNNNGWNYNDVRSDETLSFPSVSRPDGSSKPRLPLDGEIKQSSLQQQRKPWLKELLQKEITKPTPTDYTMEPSKYIHESSNELILGPITSAIYTPTTENITPTFFQPTIPPTSMTTDSLFSHYKQPIQPLQGPMYLIIEGHSKVKTYGSKDNETTTINQHEPKIVPVPSKEDVIIKHVVAKDEKGESAEIKHLSEEQPNNSNNSTEEPSAMKSLLSFLDTSLGNFFLNEIEEPQNKTEAVNIATNTSVEDEIREGRQIFDYDQLPESELKDLDEDNQKTTIEPKSFGLTIESELSTTEVT